MASHFPVDDMLTGHGCFGRYLLPGGSRRWSTTIVVAMRAVVATMIGSEESSDGDRISVPGFQGELGLKLKISLGPQFAPKIC